MKSSSSLRIVVCGYVVRGPLGGLSWHHIQYALGLADLGHEVWFYEDSGDYEQCYDPARGVVDADAGYGLAYAQRVFDRVGFGQRWAYHDHLNGGVWRGPVGDRMRDVCRSADLMLNVSGINPLRPWLREVAVRVLVDTDPVFTQVDILNDPVRRAFAEGHNAFFTFAENFGQRGCSVPDDGLPWQPTRQPVLMRLWPASPGPADGAWTTVMQWDSYNVRHWQGRSWGMKSQEMEQVLDLPSHSSERFELALGGPTAPRDRLTGLGWTLRDPLAVTRDPWTYQDYLCASKAEFSVAKHGYVASASGWFSERSANYMALGRPVVAQDSGFTRHLPCGVGLLAFDTRDQALDAVRTVAANYPRHAAAALEIARTAFDPAHVLGPMIDRAFAAARG
jgi:hypothetical protein